jgi:hypothetical protein
MLVAGTSARDRLKAAVDGLCRLRFVTGESRRDHFLFPGVLVAGLLLCASPTWAAISASTTAAVSNTVSGTGATSITLTRTQAAGNTVVVVVETAVSSGSVETVSTITDTGPGGSTYSFQKAVTLADNLTRVEIWSTAANGSAAATSLTVTLANATNGRASAAVFEYLGVAALGATQSSTQTGTNPSISSPTQDPNNWVVAGFGGNARNTISSPSVAGNFRTTKTNFGSACCPGEVALNDNTAAGSPVVNTLTEGTSEGWGIVTLELRSQACGTVSDATYVVENAQSTQTTVYWPSGTSVLILEMSGSAVTDTPVGGTNYSVGANMPNGSQVKYVGTAGSYNHTGLTPGTTYYSTVFVKNGSNCYSPGLAINATPASGSGQPQWSYATTAALMAPASFDPSDAKVLVGSNDNNIHAVKAADGTMFVTPYSTSNTVQAQPSVVPQAFSQINANTAYITSEDGHVYAVKTDTSSQVWSSPGLGLSGHLQSGSAVWLQLVKSRTICGTSTDVVFFGTHLGNTSTNSVYALNGGNTTVTSTGGGKCVANGTNVSKGGVLWTYTGGGSNPNMDIISSTPYVDYTNNILWVTSRSAGGMSQPSLWKFDVTNGTLANLPASTPNTWNLGDIDSSPTPSADGKFMYVGTNAAGTLNAIQVSSTSASPIATYTPATGTGAVNGLPWPLSFNPVGVGTPDTIIFTRQATVHSVNFTGQANGFSANWNQTLTGPPSAVGLAQQQFNTATSATSLPVTISSTTVGNLLVMIGGAACSSLQSVTGGGVTSWQKAAGSYTYENVEIWYGVVSTSSNAPVTLTVSSASCPSGTDMRANVTEYSGLVATQSQVFDVGAAQSGTGTTASASITTQNANDAVFFGVSQGGSSGIGTLGGSWWAMQTTSTAAATQSSWAQQVSSTGAFNPSVSVTAGWDAAIAAFKVALVAPNVSPPVDDGNNHLYIGGSDGKVHQLDVATGTDQKQVTIPGGGTPTVGAPVFDFVRGAIYVGASDGHLYSFATPF